MPFQVRAARISADVPRFVSYRPNLDGSAGKLSENGYYPESEEASLTRRVTMPG